MYKSHSITSLKYRIKIIGTKINRIYTNLEICITYIRKEFVPLMFVYDKKV